MPRALAELSPTRRFLGHTAQRGLIVSLQLCANPQNQTQGGVGSETAVEAPILSDVFTLGPTDNQPNSWAGHFSAILSWGVLNALLLPEHAATLLFVPLWVRCLSVGCAR